MRKNSRACRYVRNYTKFCGGIGCAIGTALALIAGQVIVMNIYYYKFNYNKERME